MIGTLLLGIVMCGVTVWLSSFFIPGIIIGIIGVMAAYPLYTRITKKERERLAPEVMRLTQYFFLLTGVSRWYARTILSGCAKFIRIVSLPPLPTQR